MNERQPQPFYNLSLSYEENEAQGPFEGLADGAEYKTLGEPQYDFLGTKVHLPLGIPAGPLLNSRYVIESFKHGWDIATYKTVRNDSHECHPQPNLTLTLVPGELTPIQRQEGIQATTDLTEPLNSANSFGVPSFTPTVWQPDVAKVVDYLKDKPAQTLIVSVQGTPKGDGDTEAFIEDSVQVALKAEEAGADKIEKNTSCPNEGTDLVLCYDIVTTARIAKETRQRLHKDTKYLMKLAYMSDDEYLDRFVNEVGPYVDAFTVINTLFTKILNEQGEQFFPGAGRLFSGASGDSARPYGLDMVKRLIRARDKAGLSFDVIGVAGLNKPENYNQYMEAGAVAGLSASAAIWHPELAIDTKRGMGMTVVRTA